MSYASDLEIYTLYLYSFCMIMGMSVKPILLTEFLYNWYQYIGTFFYFEADAGPLNNAC